MICAVYVRKSNDQNGVADEAKSVTGRSRMPEPMPHGRAGPSPLSTSTATTGSPALSSAIAGPAWRDY